MFKVIIITKLYHCLWCYRHEAEVASQSKVKEGVKGTPAWMAPELFDAKQITTKADVYSFGIVLWEMLTRRQPYLGCSTFQVCQQFCFEESNCRL